MDQVLWIQLCQNHAATIMIACVNNIVVREAHVFPNLQMVNHAVGSPMKHVNHICVIHKVYAVQNLPMLNLPQVIQAKLIYLEIMNLAVLILIVNQIHVIHNVYAVQNLPHHKFLLYHLSPPQCVCSNASNNVKAKIPSKL